MYVIDKLSARLQMFDSTGKFLAEIGSSGKEEGQFNEPEDVTVHSNGGVYVTDTGNSGIQLLSASS